MPQQTADNSIAATVRKRVQSFVEKDPYLKPYQTALEGRLSHVVAVENRLTDNGKTSLSDIARNHEYFGLHRSAGGWVFREWAPNATRIYLTGDMTGWQIDTSFALDRIKDNGIWEIRLSEDALGHGDLYRLHLQWPGGEGDRIPAYAHRVVQDPNTLIFNAQVWEPEPYCWQCRKWPVPDEPLLIYEAHVGMAQEDGRVGTYREFTDHIIPRIAASGYNALQLMAVQEHPYYGSFGYHVSSFFAASSRFGTPEDLKRLIDVAHDAGLAVIMDIVHSHAVNNEVEGISRFDGTHYQYFHEGHRGAHHAWDSRCFDYSKDEVLRFLLSNCRYWLEEYRFDGFRFDGITSMLYLDHGLEKAFTSYDDYFSGNVDASAMVYLTLANSLIHEIRPQAVTIAEDISGMPGLAVPVAEGGNGFDFRLAMGVPDFWIRIVKEYRDEEWPLSHLWHELTNRRPDEKTISYAESHDQALVGDKTLIFRMIDADMYDHMQINDDNLAVDRGIALYNLIRLITMATAGHGYQNFMGNEFGHPEWIDFPREGNNWSYHYARRQWSLVDTPDLKYHRIQRFDRDMIELARRYAIFQDPWPYRLYEHHDDKILAFRRGALVFVFNFHPTVSRMDYEIPVPPGSYRLVLNSDDPCYNGHGRVAPDQAWFTDRDPYDENVGRIRLYLPTRTALVLG